jgi:phytoene synthase
MAEPSDPSGTGVLEGVAGFARRHDPDRFLCALFAPPAARAALFALIAFNHELARAREAAKTPLIALMRLQWWRDAVEDAAAGKPARRHEVAAPLHAAISAGAFDAAGLLAMVDAREAEAEEEGIPTEAAFGAYLRGTAGGFAVATGRLLGAPPALLPALQEAGAAYGLAGVLRSVPALAARGRCLLPQEALAVEGLTPEAVVAAPGAAPVRAVIARLTQPALGSLPALRRRLRGLPRGALAAALPLVLARRDLQRLAAGRAIPAERGFGDRAAVALAGLLGRV